MAYGKLCEGDRIWTAAKNGKIFYQHLNELQDQLKGMCDVRNLSLSMASAIDRSAANGATSQWELKDGLIREETWTASAPILIIPIPVYSGQKIISVGVHILNASSGGTLTSNGTIELWKRCLSTGVETKIIALDDSTPFNLAGGDATVTATANTVAVDDYEYYIYVLGPYGAPSPTGSAQIFGAYATIQFGN